jgi:hypothetical protein
MSPVLKDSFKNRLSQKAKSIDRPILGKGNMFLVID